MINYTKTFYICHQNFNLYVHYSFLLKDNDTDLFCNWHLFLYLFVIDVKSAVKLETLFNLEDMVKKGEKFEWTIYWGTI